MSVLFADLVGFTSRSEQLDVEDVRGTLAPFHAMLRRVLESFGGTVEKFIGDAVMAVFGAPVAHEDDAERAVRAGLAIQDAVVDLGDDLHVRIGINTGDALVSIGADPRAGEGMVAGDVVNTAARLQSAAPIDGVLVGEATYRSTERQILFDAHEAIDAKGKVAPVRCWVARGARSLTPDTRRPTLPLVGRTRERRLLIERFESCGADRSVQLVTLIGVPGIGKTRLVTELREHVAAQTELVVWRHGHVLSYGDAIAFSALSEIVKQECGILDSDDRGLDEVKLRQAIEACGLEGTDALWVLRQVAPLVDVAATDDGGGRQEAFGGWRMFLSAIAERGPTVIVFEDLHWADDALLDFVDELVERETGVALLVVATARPELLERRPGWGGGKTNAVTLGLSPLSSDETLELIDGLIDRGLLPAGTEEQLLARAAGNPLYAQEYVRTVVERGATTSELPDSVHGLIAARVDGLSASEKSLLHDAAVIGTTAWAGALRALGERDAEEVDELIRRLERKQLLVRERRSTIAGEIELTFAHALIHDVAYEQLPRAERAEKHRRAARWLEDRSPGDVERLAHHYLRALELEKSLGRDDDRQLQDAALPAFITSARRALERHDNNAGVRYADAALALLPEKDQRAEAQIVRARALYETDTADQATLLAARDAAVQCDRLEDAVLLGVYLSGWAERIAGDGALSRTYLAQALQAEALVAPGPYTAMASEMQAFHLFLDGHAREALKVSDEGIERARKAAQPVAVGLLLFWHGAARIETGDADGITDMLESCRILEEHAHPSTARFETNLAYQLLALGKVNDGGEQYERARAFTSRTGSHSDEKLAVIGLATVAYHEGESHRTVALIDQLPSDIDEATKTDRSQLLGRARLTERPSEAAETAQAANAYALRAHRNDFRFDALALLARAEHELGDSEVAQAAIDDFLVLWNECGGFGPAAWNLLELAIVAASYGRVAAVAKASESVIVASPWLDAIRALAVDDFAGAAAILESIPSVPLRDAVLRLAG